MESGKFCDPAMFYLTPPRPFFFGNSSGFGKEQDLRKIFSRAAAYKNYCTEKEEKNIE